MSMVSNIALLHYRSTMKIVMVACDMFYVVVYHMFMYKLMRHVYLCMLVEHGS